MSGIRLRDDEAWAVLAGAHTGIFTSLCRDGRPIALPVWFVTMDRRIYLSGPSQTKKFARVRHDPRVSLLVESGVAWVDLVGVHVSGHARILDDHARVERVGAALHEKYDRFRMSRSEMPAPTRDHYETRVATIEIVPDGRILSWDNARLFATEGE